jgi:hypothetical protein
MRAAVCAITLAAVGACGATVATPKFRNTNSAVGYTGSKVCAGCHAGIYKTYIRTAMGRSMSRPQPETWNEPATVQSDSLHRDFRVFSKDGQLFQSEAEHRDGAVVFENVQRLEYAIGSGENGVSFAVLREGHLFQAPLSYYSKPGRWDLSPGFENADEGFSRPIHEACIVCHAGRPRPAADGEAHYLDPPFAEMAIGCENCHGPGQLHVAERSRGSGTLPDTSIVNPARLPARLAEDICMRCHQAGDARVLLPGKHYSDFRPGTPLINTLAIVGLRHEDSNEDLLEHHSAMKLSKCYRATNGKLGCLTCHDPHRQPDAVAAPQYFRSKCLGCHNTRSCWLDLQARQRTAPADNCIACHMPKRNVTRISHSALTNHRIPARPGEPALAVVRLPRAGLPGVDLLNAQSGQPALPLLTRLTAYGELMSRDPALRPTYLELLVEAKRTTPDDPLVLAALGRKALADGSSDAVPLLTRAVEKGTPAAATYIDLSEALIRAIRTPDAVAALERARQVFPYSKAIRKHLVLSYIRAKSYANARTALEQYVNDFPEDSFMRRLLSQANGESRESH